MNWLMIVIIACFALNLLEGYTRGFMRTVFSLVSWILVLAICHVATPIITDFLMEETNIQETITQTVSEKINQFISESEVSELEQSIPEELREILIGENGSLEQALIAGGENVVEASSVVYNVISTIVLIVVLIASRILLMAINVVLGIASKLPLIGSVDKLLGIACGAVKGILICWVILTVAYILEFTGTNTEVAALIADSQLLTLLQENNYILKMVMPK